MESELNFKRVGPVFFLVFVDLLGLTIILPILHLYATAFGATPLEIGLVAAVFPLCQLIGVPVMGSLSDRYGRKPLLLISQMTTFVSFVMLGLANSLALIVLSRVIDGLFGANIATAQAALTDLTDESNRTKALGLIGAAFGLGFIIGPVIAIAALEFTDDLGIPALIASAYSFGSILITLFFFDETLPSEERGAKPTATVFSAMRMLRQPGIGILLVLVFSQQVIFFGFEALLGLFTLSRLGLMGQGNAVIFLVVGFVLVLVQGYFIGKWSKRFGDAKLVTLALSLLAVGLVLVAITPEQPHPFYVQRIVENELAQQTSEGATEAIISSIRVDLPDEGNNGLLGFGWILLAIIPVSIGAGLIRPTLNSLLTQYADKRDYGSVLGVSAASVSAANAAAPVFFGLLFQAAGSTVPFLLGGLLMGLLAVVSMATVKPVQTAGVGDLS